MRRWLIDRVERKIREAKEHAALSAILDDMDGHDE